MTKLLVSVMLPAVAAIAAVTAPLGAQECVPPSPPQRAAFARLEPALHRVVGEPLPAMGWLVEREASGLDALTIAVAPAPVRPMMACNGEFELALRMNPESPLARSLQRQADSLRRVGTRDALAKMFHLVAAQTLAIRSSANYPYLREPHEGGTITRLPIKGPDLAFRVTYPSSDATDEQPDRVALCYGPWGSRPIKQDYVPFPFVHRPGTPYIENFCVTIEGMREAADPVLQRIDWTQLRGLITSSTPAQGGRHAHPE